MSNKSVYTSGQFVKVTTIFEDQGVVTTGFQKGIECGVFMDIAEALANKENYDRTKVREALGLFPLEFYLTVNSDRGFGGLVEDACLGWVDTRSINERRFPLSAKGCAETIFELQHPNFLSLVRTAAPEVIVEGLIEAWRKEGYRPATIEEFLAFCRLYHSFGRKVPVCTMLLSKPGQGQTHMPWIGSPNPNQVVLKGVSITEALSSHYWFLVTSTN
jgi:hypothetical protein